MRPMHYILAALALVALYFLLKGREDAAQQPQKSVRPGRVPSSATACPPGWVYADGQCRYRYKYPWQWQDFSRPI
jgi:hypothetical protein